MPRKPSVRSMVATLLGLLIAVPAAVLISAAPASAAGKCCHVSLSGVPGSFTAGGPAQTFSMNMRNVSLQVVNRISAVFSLAGADLNRRDVHLQREAGGSWRNVGTSKHGGVVQAIDTYSNLGILAFPPGSTLTEHYRLRFDKQVPAGHLSISVALVKDRNTQAQAGPYQSSIIVAGPAPAPSTQAPAPSDSPLDTPIPSDTADLGGVTDQSTLIGSVSSGGDGGGAGGLMWLAYMIGALLLLGGIGVIGTMLWRRGATPVETQWDEPDGLQAYPAPGEYQGYQAPTGASAAPTQLIDREAVTRPAGSEPPWQAARGRRPSGRHAASPPAHPTPQDPFEEVDQTWIDQTRVDPRRDQ